VGVGADISIRELATLIQGIVGYEGEVRWNSSMPDGTPRKLLDIGRLKNLGYTPKISLADGIADTYRWFQRHVA
jgi:GDP-L-fucose synthase